MPYLASLSRENRLIGLPKPFPADLRGGQMRPKKVISDRKALYGHCTDLAPGDLCPTRAGLAPELSSLFGVARPGPAPPSWAPAPSSTSASRRRRASGCQGRLNSHPLSPVE